MKEQTIHSYNNSNSIYSINKVIMKMMRLLTIDKKVTTIFVNYLKLK